MPGLIEKAKAFAIDAHGDQVRKYTGQDDPLAHPCVKRCWRVGSAVHIEPGGKCTECGQPWPEATPYWHHCEEVAAKVALLTNDEEVIAAAWLHDVLEDTDVGSGRLWDAFGKRVQVMVYHLSDVYTHETYPQCNRAWRKAKEAARLGACSPEVRLIKLCDVMSNAASIEEHGGDFAKVWLAEKEVLVAALMGGQIMATQDETPNRETPDLVYKLRRAVLQLEAGLNLHHKNPRESVRLWDEWMHRTRYLLASIRGE